MAKNEKATGIVSSAEDAIKSLINGKMSENYGIGKVSQILSGFLNTVNQMVHPFSQVQKEAIELAKSIGLSSKSIMAISTNTIRQNQRMQLSMSYNMSSPEMINMQQQMLMKLGRNVGVDQVGSVITNANGERIENFDSEIENLIAASKVFGVDNVSNIVGGFDKLGKSMKAAAKYTGKLFSEAGEYGINLTKYTENFTNNLEMAQMYNFRRGVDGLREMARKATEIRQDMKQVASFADKVGTVTGAVETAANLQVLGGSFAALSNPLAMLNESLTDMNGLQDRLNEMTAGAATYNSVTHQIEMDPVTRQIMKRAAESMGVDPANLIDQAYAQARRIEIERQAKESGIGVNSKILNLLQNAGTINEETGRAGAMIGGEFKTIEEIAAQSGLQKQLIEETRSESDDIKQIAKGVMGINDLLEGRRKQIENKAAANNIEKSSVSGISVYDYAFNFVNEHFTPKVIEAAGNLDLALEGLIRPIQILAMRVGTGLAEPFTDFSDPEKFKKAWEEYITNNFDEGEGATQVGRVVGNVGKQFSSAANKISNYTSQFGYNPMSAFETREVGNPGREAPITPHSQETTPIASNTGNTQQPGFGVLRTTVQTQNNVQPLWWTGYNTQPFRANDKTMNPGVVSSTEQGSATQGSTARTNGNISNLPYKLELSGTLTMNVNGDNGKIGSLDLIKMLEKDEGFRRNLAKIISDTVAKMSSSGLDKNQ